MTAHTKQPWIDRLLCFLGVHGPDLFGWRGHRRASRTAPFERQCECCGAVWHGRPVETRNCHYLGDWVRVK